MDTLSAIVGLGDLLQLLASKNCIQRIKTTAERAPEWSIDKQCEISKNG